VKWSDWGPKNLSARTYDSISKQGASSEWWVYLDDIPIWRISNPFFMVNQKPVPKRWPDDFIVQAKPPVGRYALLSG